MRHHASVFFWECYRKLPASIQRLADKNYELLKQNQEHPSLHFKRVGRYRSVRIGIAYRALGIEEGDVIIWFWIGSHDEYERLINQ